MSEVALRVGTPTSRISPTRLNDFLTSGQPTFVGITDSNLYFVSMTRGKILTLSTAAFYLLLVAFMFVLDPVSPIGSCSSSSSMLIFLSFPFLAGLGLIISLIFWARGHRSGKGPAIVNGTVLVAFFLLLLDLGWLH